MKNDEDYLYERLQLEINRSNEIKRKNAEKVRQSYDAWRWKAIKQILFKRYWKRTYLFVMSMLLIISICTNTFWGSLMGGVLGCIAGPFGSIIGCIIGMLSQYFSPYLF